MRSTIIVLSLLLSFAAAVPAARAGSSVSGRVEIRSKGGAPPKDNSGVVVYLKEVNGNKGFRAPDNGSSMSSEDMKFAPEVLPILVGTSVAFPNKDETVHNAFSISPAKKFDLGRYGYGETNSVRFDTPGAVNVFCKIHPNMVGYILVLANPYFTVTDERGNYSIKDVPPGTYKVVSWFPYGDSQEKKVDLTADAKADFSLIKLRNSNSRKMLTEK